MSQNTYKTFLEATSFKSLKNVADAARQVMIGEDQEKQEIQELVNIINSAKYISEEQKEVIVEFLGLGNKKKEEQEKEKRAKEREQKKKQTDQEDKKKELIAKKKKAEKEKKDKEGEKSSAQKERDRELAFAAQDDPTSRYQ